LGALYRQPTQVALPLETVAPAIDGTVTPDEWAGANAFSGFYSYATGRLMDDGPVLFLQADARALQVLFVVPLDADRDPVARVAERDGQVFTDDSVELFLQTSTKDLFQVVVNSLGTVADYRNGSVLWNGSVSAGAGRVEGAALPEPWRLAGGRVWLAEIALPWADLGIAAPAPGLILKANAAVNRPTPWAVFAPTSGRSYAEPERFCDLVLVAPESPRAQVLGLGDPGTGDADLLVCLLNPGPAPAHLTIDLDLRKEGSTLAQDAFRTVLGVIHSQSRSVDLAPGAQELVSVKQKITDPAVDRMAYRVSAGDGPAARTLCLRSGPVAVAPPLAVTVDTVPSRGYAVLGLDTSGLKGRLPSATLEIAAEVADAAGRVVLARTTALPIGRGDLQVDCAGVPAGAYVVRVRARHGGAEVAAAETTFRVGAAPEWLSSTVYDGYGQVDRVPLPWTPVAYAERAVSVWGRTYAWRQESLLPSSIQSQGRELLAAPVQVVGSRAGRSFVVPLGSFQLGEQRRSRAAFIAQGEAEGLAFTADCWVEYDGLLWVTLSAEDRGGTGQPVDSLRVLASLPAPETTLYQTFSRKLAGWVGDQPIPFAWIADSAGTTVNFYHWFGNERGGLGFTYTSLEHWLPQSPERFCELRPGKEVTAYAMNLIEAPARLDGRSFVFGLQATPVKPLPPDYHAMLAASVQFAPWKAWEQVPEAIDMLLTWPTPTGFAMKGLQDPYHVDGKIIADYAKQAHGKGVDFVGLASCPQKICALDEWFADYRLEWLAQPESQLTWDGIAHLQNCGRPLSLRKWLFHGWAVENVQRYGLDGLYFDGWQAGTMGCSNPHHGCGWTDAQGRRQLTVPVLEGREFSQRLLLFLEDNVDSPYVPPKAGARREGFPRYHYWIHSWEFVPPVMGFATEWLTGEFAGYPLSGPSLLTPEGTYGKCLGLGLFRSRALSTNWGVPNLFDTLMWEHTENHPTDRQTLMAYAWFLPHGVPAGLIEYANQKTLVELTRSLQAFGTRTARFTPCWEANPYLAAEPALPQEVMVATWDHGEAGPVLAVVSNLNVSERRQASLKWLGAKPPTSARDARSGQPIELVDGRLVLDLGPETFALVVFGR
jgi:hypothetical protein